MLTGAVLALAGCTAEVAVDVPSPGPEAAAVCSALVADLPERVVGQPTRDVAADPGAPVAAWGTPPITLRCGVPAPAALEPTSQCYEVDGVGWFAEQGTDGWLFTTIGRTAFVEVGVPSRYAPEADALVDLAPAVRTHDPLQTPCV
ncbi:DUF3515 domain-containing protein [Desertihabitans brevis]|uniref:DUF3515 domain-containing protein n=1 Tax=Desertihabitans brevis TaxID=2268447 RepID=A0A367Z071_9ACTN|nr:DUF3515 domain-containing protein [Desertihabitans brevis]